MTDENDDESSESSDAIPWITPLEVFSRYGKTLPQIKKLVAERKLRKKNINGKDVYSVEDLKGLSGEVDSSPEATMADLVRAAKDMLAQVQSHHAVMFDKYMGAFAKLLVTQTEHAEKQNAHIINLEKQALEMREATEKVFNLEHTRKMEELKEERTKVMQQKALDMLQKTLGPWIAQKLGAMGGAAAAAVPPETGGGVDPRFAMLGQEVVGMVVTMTDENFQAMRPLIGDERWEILAAIRMQAKVES